MMIMLLRKYNGGMLAAMNTMHNQFRLIDQGISTGSASFVSPPIGDYQIMSDPVKLFDPFETLQIAFFTKHRPLLL
jgi:hypothetical protein